LTLFLIPTIIPYIFRNKGFSLTKACPISFNRIDANLVRIIAIQVISIALLLIFTQELIFALILFFDFTVRILNLKQFSILAYIAQSIIKYFKIEVELCDEAPKRFALYLGIVIISIFTLLYFFQLNILASILVSILLLCAFLEATFDYCVGCKIYHLLQYIQVKN
jgi:hypothetical protein